MLLIEEKLTLLYIGCNQVLEALRNVMTNKTFGALNNPQFEDLLISLSATADEILEYDPQQKQDELYKPLPLPDFKPSPLFQQDEIKDYMRLITDTQKDGRYFTLFNSTLQTILDSTVDENIGDYYKEYVSIAILIVNEAMKQLNHQVEQ